MGLLKEKSAYVPTPFERAAAWIVTLGSAAVVAAFLLRALLARS
jgi:hypothetical protein